MLYERLSFHIRHGEKHEVVHFVHRVDRHDVGVREACGGLCLTQETLLQRGLRGVLRREQLERHGPIERDLVRQVHDAHATAAELLDERVAAHEYFLECQGFKIRRCQPFA